MLCDVMLCCIINVYLKLGSGLPNKVVYLKLGSGMLNIVVYLKLGSGYPNIVVYLKLGPAVKLTCLRMQF